KNDLLAAGTIVGIAGPPVRTVPAVVIAAVVRPAAAVAARRRIEQQPEVRPGLALDPRRRLRLGFGRLRQGEAGGGRDHQGGPGDSAADAAEGETGRRHGSTPSLTALLGTGDLGEYG